MIHQHIAQHSLAAWCQSLEVSASGYYAWRKRQASPMQASKAVDQAVKAAYERHAGKAGAPCLTADVQQALGVSVSQRTVGRSLHKQALIVRAKRKFRHTTDAKHQYPIKPNLLDRRFTVDRPNRVWVGDITYLQTSQGWLYLAVMIDLYSRQVVGWQMSHRIDQTLVNDALQAALYTRGKPKGVMVHTDRGSQYCAQSFGQLMQAYQLVHSMSRKANCWDNAVAESFFASLKKQAIYPSGLQTQEQMRQTVFEYIEIYYNRVRRHQANGWITPVQFECLYYQQLEGSTV